jgi:hypothetical protein
MNCKGFGRKRSWPNLRFYPDVFLDGLRKATNSLHPGCPSPGRHLNPGPFENEAGVLTTRSRLSVVMSVKMAVFWNVAPCSLISTEVSEKLTVFIISMWSITRARVSAVDHFS